ncbi:nucleotidyltransferase family protein [Flavobacterium piscis]|uniref:Molybdenum cofactor cytidylyltransferase n=1 Tax=Flavobacterium piscis TaxID=1114874 RepID=A0ABU1YDN7_9FLAO|nr:nucleotidyltransferase family protein [Flavobacterium piscis]MDR7212348.1 molybdenum cofactor cytidylyltransferase [Flavobacterium piscis]
MEQVFGIILLAAGTSSRLGKPKQLLKFNETTLLQNAIIQAKSLPNSLVLAVTGAYKELIDWEVAITDTSSVHNPNWQLGMASSIAIGLNKLREVKPTINTCIISVCDQPYISTAIFKDLINKYNESGKGIVASEYADTLGTPVLFSSNYFDELLNLKRNEGAKKILQRYKEDVASVPFEKGAIDIDTIDDYNNIINQ